MAYKLQGPENFLVSMKTNFLNYVRAYAAVKRQLRGPE
jgi:hypothetical protein